MSLEPGTRLGPYEIVALLGSGGMGEVYRARDPRLSRAVAIKILNGRLTREPDARERLLREARAASALNHPNIVTVHDVGSADGTDYIVMELVDGQSLDRRIESGLMTIDEAVRCGIEIADALAAAHAVGIVHRDLKPANAILTRDSRIKVVDFGTARALHAGTAGGDATVTVEEPMAREARVAGSAAYMSPEQVAGRPVDARSDLFSFGVLLYEIVAGRRAFETPTPLTTLAAVLEQDPPPITTIAPKTPHALVRIIRRCLQKDPAQRFQSAADLKFALESVLEDVQRPAPIDAQSARPAPNRSRLAIAALTLAAVAILSLAVERGRRASPAASALGPISRLTWDPGFTSGPTISADGKLVVYASDRSGGDNLDLWAQQVSGGMPVRITNDPADDHQPSLSRDGGRLTFRAERDGGGVYIMPALGGDARLIGPRGRHPHFSTDGRDVAFWSGSDLGPRDQTRDQQTFVVDSAGGAPRLVAGELAFAAFPLWLPDGALMVLGRREPDAAVDWWRITTKGHPPVATGAYARFRAALLTTTGDAAPVPEAWLDGEVLFSAVGPTGTQNLWAIHIDSATGAATSRPRRLTIGSGDEVSVAGAAGALTFATRGSQWLILGLPLDADRGQPRGGLRPLRPAYPARTGRSSISDDGRYLAFPVTARSETEVRVRDLTTGDERQLAIAHGDEINPIISRDGASVAYTSAEAGQQSGYVIAASGGVARRICARCTLRGWMADGRRIIISEGANGSDASSQFIALDTRTAVRQTVLDNQASLLSRGHLAPDERWIVFLSDEWITVAPFRPGSPPAPREWVRLVKQTDSLERPCGWSPDGRLVYMLLARDSFRCLWAQRIDHASGRAIGEPFPVQHFHRSNLRWGSTTRGQSVVPGLFLADLIETTGSVWVSNLTNP